MIICPSGPHRHDKRSWKIVHRAGDPPVICLFGFSNCSWYFYWHYLHVSFTYILTSFNSFVLYCWVRHYNYGLTTVYPKKYAHGFCFAVLCWGYTLTDFPISIRLTSLALWQSSDCPSASKATLMNMDKYFMWIHYERLHNHNKAKHNKTVCIFLGIYCKLRTIKICILHLVFLLLAPFTSMD